MPSAAPPHWQEVFTQEVDHSKSAHRPPYPGNQEERVVLAPPRIPWENVLNDLHFLAPPVEGGMPEPIAKNRGPTDPLSVVPPTQKTPLRHLWPSPAREGPGTGGRGGTPMPSGDGERPAPPAQNSSSSSRDPANQQRERERKPPKERGERGGPHDHRNGATGPIQGRHPQQDRRGPSASAPPPRPPPPAPTRLDEDGWAIEEPTVGNWGTDSEDEQTQRPSPPSNPQRNGKEGGRNGDARGEERGRGGGGGGGRPRYPMQPADHERNGDRDRDRGHREREREREPLGDPFPPRPRRGPSVDRRSDSDSEEDRGRDRGRNGRGRGGRDDDLFGPRRDSREDSQTPPRRRNHRGGRERDDESDEDRRGQRDNGKRTQQERRGSDFDGASTGEELFQEVQRICTPPAPASSRQRLNGLWGSRGRGGPDPERGQQQSGVTGSFMSQGGVRQPPPPHPRSDLSEDDLFGPKKGSVGVEDVGYSGSDRETRQTKATRGSRGKGSNAVIRSQAERDRDWEEEKQRRAEEKRVEEPRKSAQSEDEELCDW
uniref:Uncharacterized protein n=1 Tax=Chromera velia CCMP2878 TaxID=1169474 RepID=A0A0G4FVS5_9ALVE|eukprot:Cvel_3775.t1-p1 / transcript=Cvel_3775.t1 / gene=Cvel_3775 / organism=Chromera_velia_CCMP2878 / gene_product=hypothetical protein / transcript_product=hypothetical protein / location=Cvel_scaffold158:54448-56523(-) / protein_length=542 / sequence_SO=supercontig / SO=protein_coding / is_pseudo=false